MGWVSPSSHNDPANCWNNEANAYDGSTGTYASTGAYSADKWLELILSSSISCDKVRAYLSETGSTATIVIEVYYSGGWHEIYSGALTMDTWKEYPIGSTQTVEKARIRASNLGFGKALRVYEFEFNEIAPPAAKTLVQAALISIAPLIVLPTLGQILKLTGGC